MLTYILPATESNSDRDIPQIWDENQPCVVLAGSDIKSCLTKKKKKLLHLCKLALKNSFHHSR